MRAVARPSASRAVGAVTVALARWGTEYPTHGPTMRISSIQIWKNYHLKIKRLSGLLCHLGKETVDNDPYQ
jgi:hypothetical protein